VAQGKALPDVTSELNIGLSFEHLDFNFKNEHLANPAVRKAIATGLNIPESVDRTVKQFTDEAQPLGNQIDQQLTADMATIPLYAKPTYLAVRNTFANVGDNATQKARSGTPASGARRQPSWAAADAPGGNPEPGRGLAGGSSGGIPDGGGAGVGAGSSGRPRTRGA